MAKDFWDKIKISSDIFKNNRPMILMCLTALGSGAGNIGQYFGLQDKEDEKNQAVHEVTMGFQQVLAEAEPVEVKLNCSYCRTEINKLKEWHK